MEPNVQLGPGADTDPVAREIRRRVVANLERGRCRRAFARMWGTVVVATARSGALSEDGLPGEPETTITLRFDWGRLMIHEGRVGRPDVTLWGTADDIFALGELGGDVRRKLGAVGMSDTLAPMWALFALRRRPGLKIYGLRLHARLVWRLARLLDSRT